jgi:hypothetical protein
MEYKEGRVERGEMFVYVEIIPHYAAMLLTDVAVFVHKKYEKHKKNNA